MKLMKLLIFFSIPDKLRGGKQVKLENFEKNYFACQHLRENR